MNQIVETKQSPTAVFRDQFQKMQGEVGAALPPHIPVERFMRVVLTAVNASPELLNADRRSLFQSAMKAAQDGLLPDGRDGALVIFGGKVQWMPMIGGILKKVRNSGELESISAHVVHEKDEFEYQLGDDEKIIHKPALGERGAAKLVYAIAKTKDGGVYREIMTVADVEKVRAVSRAGKSGPWVQWWGEMARKTVIRRLSKRLPMSRDLDDLIRRDDDLYDYKNGAGAGDAMARVFAPVVNPLADDAPAPQQIEHNAETGEIIEHQETGDDAAVSSSQAAGETASVSPETSAADPDADDEWFARGHADFKAGSSRRAVPPEVRGKPEADRWLAGFDSAKDAAA